LAIFVFGIQVAPWILQQSCSKKKKKKKRKKEKKKPKLELRHFCHGNPSCNLDPHNGAIEEKKEKEKETTKNNKKEEFKLHFKFPFSIVKFNDGEMVELKLGLFCYRNPNLSLAKKLELKFGLFCCRNLNLSLGKKVELKLHLFLPQKFELMLRFSWQPQPTKKKKLKKKDF
jgi:hypothetical protein